MLEGVDRGARPRRIEGTRLVEVIVGKNRIGVGRVDPRRGDPSGRPQRKDDIESDLAGQTDTLPFGQIPPRRRPVDEDDPAALERVGEQGRVSRNGDGRGKFPRESFADEFVGPVHGIGGVGAGV